MEYPHRRVPGDRTCTFLVEAGLTVGMGHLLRSSAVAGMIEGRGIRPMFLLRGDAAAKDLALRLGLPVGNCIPGGPIVMDLVNVDQQDIEPIMACSPRVLISPVCERPALASHVLVRSASAELRSKLSESAELRERGDYAYATAAGLEPRDLCFDALRVGVCLSGGRDPAVLNQLVALVADLPNVKELRVISREVKTVAPRMDGDQVSVRLSGFTLTPWRFLDGINVFIGGHGVMVSEAIAQSIPTISVRAPAHEDKNKHMETAGAVATWDEASDSLAALATLLSDTSALERLHEAARRQAPPGTANGLAEDLYSILVPRGGLT